jgi:hypothetical protein
VRAASSPSFERIFADVGYQGIDGGRSVSKDRHLDLEVVKRNELHYFVVLPKR